MHKYSMTTFLIAAIMITVFFSISNADSLESGFINPSEDTKPWCYWYWLNSDITKDGITKDLEAMAKVGIKRALIGNIGGEVGNLNLGPVKMFSDQWYDITRYAFSEAERLGVILYMFNSPGWSQSGGPWIKPEQSMRRVTWNEFSSKGGTFSQKVRPNGIAESQDIAVLAFPKLDALSIEGKTVSSSGQASPLSLSKASWIWYPSENAATGAPAEIRYFKRTFNVDPAELASASIKVTADNTYFLTVNGKEVLKDDNWETLETESIKEYLTAGTNTIEIAVTNTEVGPAGLIAAVELKSKSGKPQRFGTDNSWQASKNKTQGFNSAEIIGSMDIMPWKLSRFESNKARRNAVMSFKHSTPFTARSLTVHGKTKGKLFAIANGNRKLVADIKANGGSKKTDFLPNAIETFSFEEVTASEFQLVPAAGCKVVLSSEPIVAQVIEKQMGRVHPTPTPTWESYIFPDTVEPKDRSVVISRKDIIDLSDKLKPNGELTCNLPKGNWDIIYFGMVTTGVVNSPAPAEGTGLEVDKMSRKHIEYHFESMFNTLLEKMTPQEKAAFKGITIDSYEKGAQNWTDGFADEFAKRNGYSPISLLPVMTGRVVDSAKASDQFLWDLRRTIADMIAEYYVAGLRENAHKHGLSLWCENYGHWGFPGEFLSYGGQTDQVGGEFWSTGSLGDIECRAASSAGHIYGKRRVYAEAYTSGLKLEHHPYLFKARGEQMFCQGINHFVLHVYAHQPRDGMPGRNPWFGTPFHRNTPWFNRSRDWVKYLQRCHYMLQQGNPGADVAVYIGDFAPQMTGPANPVAAGYDYDYMGSDAILRKLDVVGGKWVVFDENDPTRIAASYELLAMPKVKYIRPKVLKRLDELKNKGGKIINSVPVTAQILQSNGIFPVVSDMTCGIRFKERLLDEGKMFFLSNFQKTGTFEATLRVTGKAPELFNPVTGKITKLARYKSVNNGTRITIDVKDRSDSFFIVFREKISQPSVVKVLDGGGIDIAPADLKLFYDDQNKLTAESGYKGAFELIMSDDSKRSLTTDMIDSILMTGQFETTKTFQQGYSVQKEIRFNYSPKDMKNKRVYLDLGKVEVMAEVTLNGKTFDTLWMPPFTVDVTEAVKAGQNKLQVVVTSTTKGKPGLGDTIQLKTITQKVIK